MKIILASLILISATASALDDGLYESVIEGHPTKRADLKITRAMLISQNNANDAWNLFVAYSSVNSRDGNQCAVVLDGKVHKVSSWGKSGETENDFNIQIKSDAIDAAQKLFNIKPIARKHPGHKLDVTFTPAKTAFEHDDKLLVTLSIKNVGDAPFYFEVGGHQRGPRDNQFSFSCEGKDGTVTSKIVWDMGGLSTIHEIAPGKTFTKEVDLADWFNLRPGHYTLKGTYQVPIYADKKYVTGTFMLWEDFLTRPFTIEIKPAPK